MDSEWSPMPKGYLPNFLIGCGIGVGFALGAAAMRWLLGA